MFIGHFAVGFAAKKFAPKPSLGLYFMAVSFLDLLWPLLLLLGLEHVRITPGITVVTPLDLYDYPISHSLVASLVWSLLAGGLYFLLKKDTRTALIVGVAVFSHWVLDFVTHRPDMPLSFGETTYVGLGLWNSLAGTIIVEGGMFILSVVMYTRSTIARDRIGRYAYWSFVAFLLVMYFLNLFGPPPEDVTVIAVGANAAWLIVLWAWWCDRHRTSKIR
jgi:hypothetical protein